MSTYRRPSSAAHPAEQPVGVEFSGERILARPTGERPDAVFAANDLLAIGVLQALNMLSDVQVPRDIALIGLHRRRPAAP